MVVLIHARCLMSTHIYRLAATTYGSIGWCVQKINVKYTSIARRKCNCPGHPFKDPCPRGSAGTLMEIQETAVKPQLTLAMFVRISGSASCIRCPHAFA